MTPQDTPTPQKDMKVLLQMNEQLATTNAKLERSLAAAQAHMELAKNVVRAWKLYKRKYAEGFCGDIYWVGVEQELDELCSALTPHGIGRTVVFREDYDALHTRLRAAERDAARYRGFRSALINSDAEEPAVWIQDAIGNSVTEAEFDAAIDSGLAREDAA
jgi:hypothetical protein